MVPQPDDPSRQVVLHTFEMLPPSADDPRDFGVAQELRVGAKVGLAIVWRGEKDLASRQDPGDALVDGGLRGEKGLEVWVADFQ